jgi:hypothetical protein
MKLTLALLGAAAHSTACVELGEKNVTAKDTAARGICALHCEAVERGECDVPSPTCEADCKAEVAAYPDCKGFADNYYGCTPSQEQVRCEEDGTAVFPRCQQDLDKLLECRASDAESGDDDDVQAPADDTVCSEFDEVLDCVSCCYYAHESGASILVVADGECVCEADNCGTPDACLEYCTDESILELPDACSSCWDDVSAAGTCDAAGEAECSRDEECQAFNECVSRCG